MSLSGVIAAGLLCTVCLGSGTTAWADVRGVTAEPTFDPAAAVRLLPARRAELDVQFFNEFWVKGESGPANSASARATKIRKMAAEGFEVAYLAERLYNFERNGIPSFRSPYLPYWKRLGQLAETGDPSAQCLFSHAAVEYRSFNQDPPTVYDVGVLAPRYRKAAATQGHPYCAWLWIAESGETDDKKISETALRCAGAGATVCQQALASRYRNGLGLPKDGAKALCWAAKARSGNSAPSVENGYRLYVGLLRNELGPERVARIVEAVTADTDCEKSIPN